MSMPMAVDPVEAPLSWTDRLIGVVAFLLAVLALRLPFRRVVAVARWAKRWCVRPATVAEAEVAVAAARRGGGWYPGRAACLELSLAAVFAAAVRRRAVDWCIGVARLPPASHAWVAVEGQPIGESPALVGAHRPLHVV